MNLRTAEPGDVTVILALMKRFAEFEGLDAAFAADDAGLHEAIFGETGFVKAIVAEMDGRIVAYALFYPYFSSFRGQAGYYLEDLFVVEEFRFRGTGEAMLRMIARMADERGLKRIDFGVLAWNTAAIDFYEKLGAVGDPDERHFKFTDDAFRRLAGKYQ